MSIGNIRKNLNIKPLNMRGFIFSPVSIHILLFLSRCPPLLSLEE